jgi:hypothetical protein
MALHDEQDGAQPHVAFLCQQAPHELPAGVFKIGQIIRTRNVQDACRALKSGVVARQRHYTEARVVVTPVSLQTFENVDASRHGLDTDVQHGFVPRPHRSVEEDPSGLLKLHQVVSPF